MRKNYSKHLELISEPQACIRKVQHRNFQNPTNFSNLKIYHFSQIHIVQKVVILRPLNLNIVVGIVVRVFYSSQAILNGHWFESHHRHSIFNCYWLSDILYFIYFNHFEVIFLEQKSGSMQKVLLATILNHYRGKLGGNVKNKNLNRILTFFFKFRTSLHQ
jgi:hypothetical protein